MRWIVSTVALGLALSLAACQSLSEPAKVAAPCPQPPKLSSSEQRKALIQPLAEGFGEKKRQQFIELLKLLGLDIANILAAYRQLELRADCENDDGN